MSSHAATITLFQGTAQEQTIVLQEWRCRPEPGSRAELVEWFGHDPSQVLHHHIPLDTVPRAFHPSQKLRMLDLTFEHEHSHHIMLFDNDQIAHDQLVPVEYSFTFSEVRGEFQGDILGKIHVTSFDISVVWSDSIHETNKMGNVEGMAIL
jgi:hypothetical protein